MTSKLIKLRLSATFDRMLSGKKSGSAKSKFPMALLYALLVVYFSGLFSVLAWYIAPMFISIGADWFYFFLFIGIDFLLVFIFGVFEAKTEIFECRDNELLLSMPIKPISIVSSRVLTVIIWNYIESAFVLIPASVVYAIRGGSALGVCGSLLMLLFVPLLPTALSCFVGFLLSAVTSRFKRKTLISVLLFAVFFGAYMYGYSTVFEKAGSALINVLNVVGESERFSFIRYIGEAALLRPIPLLLVALASVLSAAVAILLISLAFEKIATRKSGEVKTEYKAKSMSSSSAVVALIKKELLRFFGSAMYIINAGIGIVLTVLLSGYLMFKLDSFESTVSLYGTFFGADIGELMTVTLVGALTACISFSYISACSISLEGKNLWVLKSLPLRAWEVLLAKMLTHIILVLPLALVSSVLLLIASGDYNYAWYYLLMPVFACVASSAFGIIINVRFPKLDFTNEAMVIKQSLASTIVMFSGMAFGIGITVLSAFILCKTNLILATVLPLLLTALIAVSLVVVVFKVSTKRYEAL